MSTLTFGELRANLRTGLEALDYRPKPGFQFIEAHPFDELGNREGSILPSEGTLVTVPPGMTFPCALRFAELEIKMAYEWTDDAIDYAANHAELVHQFLWGWPNSHAALHSFGDVPPQIVGREDREGMFDVKHLVGIVWEIT